MTEITIPVEGVKLDGNTVYKLKGLEASMTYEVTLTSDKFVNLEITEDEDEQAKVLASGALYNAPFKFTATATTARLVVEAPTGANLTLTAKQATAAPAAVDLVSPAKPNTLYQKTGLTVGRVYEVAVSGNVPHVVQMAWEGGTTLPPLVAVDGTVQVTAQTVQLNLWLDSAEDAEITITEATSILPVTQDADVTGTWSFSNVSGLTMKDEAPILLGQGDNALKIHGTGAGKAVIEGGNATELDVAVPVNLQEPITVAGGATFDSGIMVPETAISYFGPMTQVQGTEAGGLMITGHPGEALETNLVYTKKVSPNQTTRILDITHTTLDRYGGYFQFISDNGYLQYYTKYDIGSVSANLSFTVEPRGQLNFQKLVTFAGPTVATNASTFGNTITVAGLATFSGHAKIKGHLGLGATDGSAEISFTPVATNQLSVLGDQGAHVDIYTPPEASAGAPLAAEDKLLTQGECDARYVLFVQTTQEDYDGLAVKNPGTIYHTQDTGIFYIGDKQLTTA